MNDRISDLEQRLSVIEAELAATNAKLDRKQTGTRISIWAGRVIWVLGLAVVAAAATHGEGKMAPVPLTVKAPFTVDVMKYLHPTRMKHTIAGGS